MALLEEIAATAAVSEEAATSAATYLSDPVAAATVPTQNATRGSPWTPAPGSTGGTPWTPAASSAHGDPPGSLKIPILIDWWLEKVEDEEGKIRVAGFTFTPPMMSQILRKGASSSKGHKNKKLARRFLRSKAIVKQYDLSTIEDEDGRRIKIGALLNTTKTRENGFSEKVCECFYFGFTDMWQKVINPEMVPDNEHAQSPSETTTGAPSASVEDYIAYFLSDSFSSSFRHDISVTDNNFDSFVVGYSGKTDGLTTQSLSNLPDNNAGNITSGLHGLRMHVPEKPLAPPGEACNCAQAEEDDDIPQWNMHSCSSGHGMVSLPTDRTSSQLGEPGIPKSGKDSVNLGTTDALELPTEGMTPKFGAIGGSEESTGIRLRSGRVLEMSSGGPMKSGHKQKKIQLDASSKQMVNQGAASTADLTSHEHDFSAAEVVVEEKLESHDSFRKGRERPRKGDKKR